jgi:hypothetical protein
MWSDAGSSHNRERHVSKALRFLRTWFLVSIPVGLFVGKFIKAGKGPVPRDDARR